MKQQKISQSGHTHQAKLPPAKTHTRIHTEQERRAHRVTRASVRPAQSTKKSTTRNLHFQRNQSHSNHHYRRHNHQVKYPPVVPCDSCSCCVLVLGSPRKYAMLAWVSSLFGLLSCSRFLSLFLSLHCRVETMMLLDATATSRRCQQVRRSFFIFIPFARARPLLLCVCVRVWEYGCVCVRFGRGEQGQYIQSNTSWMLTSSLYSFV